MVHSADCPHASKSVEELAVGEDHPTIVTFDMALYEKVLQLLDARPQLKKMIVPRLGELHAIMAAMRGLGSSIENSGIDDAWIEADVFGVCQQHDKSSRSPTTRELCLHTSILPQFFMRWSSSCSLRTTQN